MLLIGGLEHDWIIFHFIYGMSSFPSNFSIIYGFSSIIIPTDFISYFWIIPYIILSIPFMEYPTYIIYGMLSNDYGLSHIYVYIYIYIR